MDAREVSPRVCQHQVKWKGYSSEHDSWEHESMFQDRVSVTKFWKDPLRSTPPPAQPAAAPAAAAPAPSAATAPTSSSEAAHPVDSSAPLAISPSNRTSWHRARQQGACDVANSPFHAPLHSRRYARCAIHPFVGGGMLWRGLSALNRWSRFEFPCLGTLLLPSHLWCGFSSWAGPPGAAARSFPVRHHAR